MEEFIAFVLFCVGGGWLIWKIGKINAKPRTNSNRPQRTSLPVAVPADSDWERKNAPRNRFVQLYKDKNWQGIVDEFDGYDFTQHYEEFNDYQAMAIAWMWLGNEEKAGAYVERAAASSHYLRKKAEAYLNMAILCRENEKYDQALEWLLKADPSGLRAEKDWELFYRAMRVGAECFMRLGLIDEGITFLKQAPTSARILDRDLADVFEWLGQFYEQKGDFGKALKAYQKVVTVRYDKEINRRILDLNQLVYEAEKERDDKRAKRKRKEDGQDF